MTQETMMTDQPTTITEAPASTEAGQVAPKAQAPAVQPVQEQQQQQGEGQQTEEKAEEQVPEQYADFAFEEGISSKTTGQCPAARCAIRTCRSLASASWMNI